MKNADNIQPYPNPKPLSVIRVQTETKNQEGNFGGIYTPALIVNAKVFPYELLKR